MKNRCRHPPWRKRSTKRIFRKQNRPTTQPNSTSPYKPKQWLWMHSNSGREMARLLHVSLAMWIAAAEQNCGRAAGRRSEKRAESAAALSKSPLPIHLLPTFFKARRGGNNNISKQGHCDNSSPMFMAFVIGIVLSQPETSNTNQV
jgi:hypothetical protein